MKHISGLCWDALDDKLLQ